MRPGRVRRESADAAVLAVPVLPGVRALPVFPVAPVVPAAQAIRAAAGQAFRPALAIRLALDAAGRSIHSNRHRLGVKTFFSA